MARTQQDILVKIKVLLEGLGNVRALAGHVKDLNSGGGQTAALAGNIDRLALAVDRLATASAKTEKSGGGFVRFLVSVSAVVQTLANISAAADGVQKIVGFLKATPDLAEKVKAGFSQAAAVSNLTTLFASNFAAGAQRAERASASVARGVTSAGAAADAASARVLRFFSLLGKTQKSADAAPSASPDEGEGGTSLPVGASSLPSISPRLGGALEALKSVSAGLGESLASLGPRLALLGKIGLALLPVFAAVGVAVVGMSLAFAGLAASAALGLLALLKIGPAGIAANSQLEQVRLGIAAVITSLAQLKVDGVPVEGAQKFRTAMQLAGEQLQKLRVDAVNTTATFEQIAPAFQAAIAPGLVAGLTLDQIRESARFLKARLTRTRGSLKSSASLTRW